MTTKQRNDPMTTMMNERMSMMGMPMMMGPGAMPMNMMSMPQASGMQMPSMGMVPRCTMKMEKTKGGMSMTCVCQDKTTAMMMQNLCSMMAGGMCSCCMMMNGMCMCCCAMTMGKCNMTMTDMGMTMTCTSGDAMCEKMIQACCDCMMNMMSAGCSCCMMMNGMPICCSM